MKENQDFSFKKLFRKNILSLSAYQSARMSFNSLSEKVHLLNANESPYLPFNSTKAYNLYPEPQPRKIKEIVSKLYEVSSEQMLITRGSDEAIDLLIRAFCEPREDSILVFSPTFGMYEFYANIQDVNLIDIPLDKKNFYQLDFSKISKIDKSKIKLIFLPNPSAPLGHLIRREDILRLYDMFKETSILVLDEAYIEFSNSKSFTDELLNKTNLVILRTFSKAYSMAGLRMGFCIGHENLILILKNILSPYPLSVSSIDFVLKCLSKESLGYIKKNIKVIIEERKKLEVNLKKLSFVKRIFPSDTNFIFLELKNAIQVLEWCSKFHFILRSFNSKMRNTIRVSIGTPEVNCNLIEVLKNYDRLNK